MHARLAYLLAIFCLWPATAFADPVSAIVAAASAGLAASGAATIAGAFAAFNFAAAAIAGALSLVSQALAPRPDTPDLSSFASIRNAGATQQFRQPVTDRRIVYGETRVSGPIVFASVTGNNRYLHLVIALASHEIEEIGEIFINDVSIPSDGLDGSGVVQSGRYANKIRIKKYLGTASQTADSDLVAEVTDWTTNHRLRGIAYIYARLDWDRDIFPAGIPNISAWVKGKKVLDTRDSTSRWTPNIPLIARDYLIDGLGLGTDSTTIDETELNGSANTAEEFVTTQNIDISVTSVDTANDILAIDGDRLIPQTGDRMQLISGTIGGLSAATDYYVIVVQRKDNPRIQLATSLLNAIEGTAIDLTSGTTGTLRKTGEPRYFGGGVLKTSAERGENLKDIIKSMAGQAVYAGGSWRILAGEYQTPTISFNESDLAGAISVQTKASERDRFNRVQGIYVTPLNDGNPSDYPAVTNSTYETEDGKVILSNYDLAFTQRPHTAQRIAKIALERSRQELVFTAKFKLTAFKVQVGDNFNFTFDRYGWSNKVFEVISWTLSTEEDKPVIEMVCRENASAVYDWNNGEETQVDPAPNTLLDNPFDVDPPTGLSVTPIEIQTAAGDLTYEFQIDWTPPTDPFVTSGGYYEVQFKRSTDSNYNTSYRAEDVDDNIRVKLVQPGTNYDVRVRSVNYLGVRSAYQTLLGFNVSSPSGATINRDYRLITGTVVDSFDYGLVTDTTDVAILDYGSIT